MEDNRESGSVCATLALSPRSQIDGTAVYDPPQIKTIPDTLSVLEGSAGSGLATLQMDGFRCRYRGDGTSYVFEGCGGPGGVELHPGDSVEISQVSLRVLTADRDYPVTSVRAVLASPGAPDFYSAEVFGPSGGSIYSFSGLMECGDIDIQTLP